MAKKPFRVVIVGASLTGLATAIALESAGIDYIVLEGGIVAPAVGATIALMGPAFRILDQLGCYEDIVEASNRPTEVMRLRKPSGVPWQESVGNMEHLIARHGYPMIFMKRQDLHRILYANVKNKDKILTGKRVEEVITATNGVMVKTRDGETFTGDILIGADGIHSRVRREMWRLAAESRPGWFPENELNKVESNYMVTFGITPPKTVQPFIDFAAQEGRTYLSAMGANGIVFWFLSNSTEKNNGNNMPRYTDKDVTATIEKYGHEQVTHGWTLRELYEESTITGAAPIAEYTYSRWHYKRILTIGDSAHVQHPISGYGGQSCLESVAAFVNALKPALEKDASAGGGLTDADFDDMFAKIQESRVERIEMLKKHARAMADVLGLKGLARYILPVLVPLGGQQRQMLRFSKVWVGATRINHLPIPKQPRAMPYDDELPADRKGTLLPKLITAAVLLLSLYLSLPGTAIPDIAFDSWAGLHPPVGNYTGTGLDGLLGILSSFFSWVLVPEDPIPRVQALELLSVLTPICAIWMIEANRKANRFSLIRLPSIITIVAQLVTFGRAGHFYWLFAIFTSTNSVAERHVPVAASRAVLPAVCLGYILPTILMFIPFQDDALRDRFTVFWQPSPLWAGILSVIFATVLGVYEKRRLTGKTGFGAAVEKVMTWYTKREMSALKNTYAFVFASSALVHISIVLYAWLEGGLPALWRLFGDVPNIFVGTSGITDPAEGVFVMLKYDFIFSVTPMLVFLLYTVWDIRNLGYITTPTARNAVASLLAGYVLVGPAAAYAGLWYWRESVFDSLSN